MKKFSHTHIFSTRSAAGVLLSTILPYNTSNHYPGAGIGVIFSNNP
ncbi:MAG TPA: hypothetical protein PLN69_04995 [bacterium]|nr:hypothetical protein [bacterium]